MKDRQKIKQQIQANETRIKELLSENQSLRNALDELTDKESWYTEKVEVSGREKVERLIGRKCWKESFKDEDTGKTITILCSKVVRIDGQPVSF